MGQTAQPIHNFRPTRDGELRNGRGVIVINHRVEAASSSNPTVASERTTDTHFDEYLRLTLRWTLSPRTTSQASTNGWMHGCLSQSPSPPTYVHTCGLSGLPQRASYSTYARMYLCKQQDVIPHLSRSTSLPSRPPLTLTSQVRRPHTQTTSAAAKPSEGLATRANRVSPWAPPGHTPSARRMRRRVRNTQHVFGGASTASLVYQVNSLCGKDNCWH
jgi:hypothetical protein